MRRLIPLSLATLALAAAGCGGDDEQAADPGAAAPAPTQTAEAEAEARVAEEQPTETRERRRGTTIALGDSQFGRVLFDGKGQAIYLFDKETSEKPECYDDCAAEWPPVLTRGEPQAGDGIDEDLLGTTEREDGTTQVTYNGHPLYFYAHEAPNEVRCHNIPGFGGVWFALDRRGDPAPLS